MSNELKAEYDDAIAAFHIACVALSKLFIVSTAVKADNSEYDAAIVAYDVAWAKVKATRTALRYARNDYQELFDNKTYDKTVYNADMAADFEVASAAYDAAWAKVKNVLFVHNNGFLATFDAAAESKAKVAWNDVANAALVAKNKI